MLSLDQKGCSTTVPARPIAVERILLLRGHQKSQFRQDVRKPYLRADPLGQECGGAR
jgi:hypothetical protein